MSGSALILGGNGRFGRNCTLAFKAAGWQVRQFDRQSDDLMQAVQGVDVIVAAWNPAYPDWATQVLQQHTQVIEAAKTVDATVIVPGNVYVYGPENEKVWRNTTPHLAQNPLGRIRIDMEAVYRNSDVRTILLRAGDFIDTQDSGNWFDMILTSKLSKGVFRYPGRVDIPHAWAFLPDLTRAAVALADRRDSLNRFEDVAFPGYTMSGQDMAHALSDVCGVDLRLKQVNWLPFRLMSPVWKMASCLLEMRYLWNTPHSLARDRFVELLPDFQETPVTVALRRAVAGKVQKSGLSITDTSTQTSR
ncbi:dTDP-4-dehydrorhamnose reductase [Shimia gijangensis]|uniref:dTDP-4-dehydrorhamnose reductase n=1 Tax=Shimia gijangensis TaxID=1470563 RepID=A0A1M6BCT4_9RHOB|nr:epimerase [Shimia gijangensis]SHI46378.1 dTDP-4-dehydrorhamnose reductase [Shimia gijangensis]